MAEGYLGEFDVKIEDTPFKDYTPTDWVIWFIGSYGQIDGAHHKLWVLDQIARILNGTSIIVKLACWVEHPPEYRITTGEPSQKYLDWVNEVRGAWNEDLQEFDCGYNEGIAP